MIGAESIVLELEPGALERFASEQGIERTVEFLTAGIHNPHTRRAYAAAMRRFARWCHRRRLKAETLTGPHVAAYVQELGGELSPASVKQHLAAIKHWFDWLVTGHVLLVNPAHAVRGPRYEQREGKTPVLDAEQARALFASIEEDTILGLRDRALISVMLFAFARVGAAVKMRVRDYENPGSPQAAFRLHEKRGKFLRVPAHHQAALAVEAYIQGAELVEPRAPLFQSAPGRSGALNGRRFSERAALAMVKRRAAAAGLPATLCNHSFRGTGITLHQDAGGDLEAARQIAGHASVKTTQLYNRSGDKRRKSEVERVQL